MHITSPESKNKKSSPFLVRSQKNEEFMVIFSPNEKERDNAEKKRLMTEFFRINKLITYGFCIPLLNNLNSVYYCGFAELPGRWLASCVRHNIINRKDLHPLIDSYDKQEHLLYSCLTHTLHLEFEKYLGKCLYSITSYERLLRISIPYENDFLVTLNLYPESFTDFKNFFAPFYEQIKKENKKLVELCVKENAFIEQKDSEEFVPYFFNTSNSELANLLRNCFINDNRVRYVATCGYRGLQLPLARYKRKDVELYLTPYEQIEYLIECGEGLKLREKFTEFFGPINFFVTVYEKATTLVIPVGDFFVLISFDIDKLRKKAFDYYPQKLSEEEKKKLSEKEKEIISEEEEELLEEFSYYYSDSVHEIFKFIKDENRMEHITVGLSKT